MKISIAMATYNGAKYLKEQLDSFVVQTLLPDELVVCDDGSKDETVEILQSFAELAPFDVHIHCNPKNLGYAQNFNRALSLCSGEMVFLSDQDDVWFPDKIKTIVKIAEDDSLNQVFMNDAELTFKDLQQTGLTKLGQIRTAGMSDRTFVMGCCAAIKKSFLKDILPVPNEYNAHDSWIVNMADGLGRKRIIEKTLQYYRRHGDNESEFIANSTRKINKITYLWQQIYLRANKDSINTLVDSKERINCIIIRLEQMLASVGLGFASIDDINKYMNELICAREATQMRIKILRTPSIKRISLIISMLVSGRYGYFQGMKSALSDTLFNN